ncbi:MAG: isocitrate lyase/phosphoenolpyruvate mutase family protein, partial [Tepidiformaceae bacterium]
MPTTAEKRSAFRELHRSGTFVIPNPWDLGSARYLQSLGFKALASTSAGFAYSRARPDNGVPREAVLAHLEALASAAELPLNADFESGFASNPEGVAESVRLCVEAGVSGLSIEDSTGDPGHPLFDIEVAVARLSAARSAIDK